MPIRTIIFVTKSYDIVQCLEFKSFFSNIAKLCLFHPSKNNFHYGTKHSTPYKKSYDKVQFLELKSFLSNATICCLFHLYQSYFHYLKHTMTSQTINSLQKSYGIGKVSGI